MKGSKSNLATADSISTFVTEGFLLNSEFARVLYHNYAKSLPIIDYHSHLPPLDLATNRRFDNLTQIWLEGDHYKWRAMRALGIEERYITGDATDHEKFDRWAFTVPYTVRNPLFHWTHLELSRYFGINTLLTPGSSKDIYQQANEQLRQDSYRVQGLVAKMKVEVICTTDDPLDSLDHHEAISKSDFPTKVLPTFRPDKVLAIENPDSYSNYLQQLSQATGVKISGFDDLLAALSNRIEYFHKKGCRLSDHGLEHLFFDANPDRYSPDTLLKQVVSGEGLDATEANFFKYRILQELCKMYHANAWVQQFHLGALRNNNTRLMQEIGADAGCDSIGDFSQAKSLSRFLDALNQRDQLAKTIVYNLNPRDNEVMASMMGNFNDGTTKGKMQYGSAWWFLDQKDGMEKQITALSNLGLLSCFVGMLTDSRSFMSFPRHEYFRRILCNLIGKDVEKGELPADEKWLGKIVGDICYHNARQYFNF